jgi:hypothetical protein
MRTARPFPLPWTVEEHPGVFIVLDANEQELGHFYFHNDPQRRWVNYRLTREEAQRMASNFAKLPYMLRGDARAKARPACPGFKTDSYAPQFLFAELLGGLGNRRNSLPRSSGIQQPRAD